MRVAYFVESGAMIIYTHSKKLKQLRFGGRGPNSFVITAVQKLNDALKMLAFNCVASMLRSIRLSARQSGVVIVHYF